jgi:hypothetical protein
MPDAAAAAPLQAAIDAYYATTDVVLPEGGKFYTITMVAKNGNKFYLNYTGSDIAMVARGEEELPNTAKFVCEDNGDGTVTLMTIDGKYLVYHTKYAGVNWLENGGSTTGLQDAKDKMTNITFAKMANGGNVAADNDQQVFGLLTWYSLRGYDTGKNEDSYGYMVLKADGSDYDGASAPFWNANFSSGFAVEETEAVPLLASAAAIAELQATTEEADAILAAAGYSPTSIVFNAIDIASNADAMLYSNAKCTNTSWGDEWTTWEYLFDNDPTTLFHSEYDNGTGLTSVDGLDHYLRVDLGEGNELSKFAFTFTTRERNCTVNSPTTIVVEGSNEADGEYTEIATITDIPQENSYKFESDVLSTADGTAYRYIRYRVTATGSMQTDGGGKIFFFISEFGMSTVEEVETPSVAEEYAEMLDAYVALAAANEAAKAVLAEEAPLADAVAEAQEVLDAAIEATIPVEPMAVVDINPADKSEVEALPGVVFPSKWP